MDHYPFPPHHHPHPNPNPHQIFPPLLIPIKCLPRHPCFDSTRYLATSSSSCFPTPLRFSAAVSTLLAAFDVLHAGLFDALHGVGNLVHSHDLLLAGGGICADARAASLTLCDNKMIDLPASADWSTPASTALDPCSIASTTALVALWMSLRTVRTAWSPGGSGRRDISLPGPLRQTPFHAHPPWLPRLPHLPKADWIAGPDLPPY